MLPRPFPSLSSSAALVLVNTTIPTPLATVLLTSPGRRPRSALSLVQSTLSRVVVKIAVDFAGIIQASKGQ